MIHQVSEVVERLAAEEGAERRIVAISEMAENSSLMSQRAHKASDEIHLLTQYLDVETAKYIIKPGCVSELDKMYSPYE